MQTITHDMGTPNTSPIGLGWLVRSLGGEKVLTMTGASPGGVAVARIKELLAAGPSSFAAAIGEIDANLRKRAEEIRRTRQRIAQLTGGDGLFVSPEVAGYLARLREIGVSERTVLLERDLWILLQAAAPAQAAAWVADKLAALEDPTFSALYLDHDAAFDWPPDDPRLPAIAFRTRQWYAARPAEPGPPPDATMTRLAAAATSVSSPAWARIAELARQGGPDA